MSETNKENKLLGKKRELENAPEKNEEKEKESPQKKQKKSEENKKADGEDDSSSSSESQPKQSLFGKNEQGFKGGLFGDLDNPQKTSSLFGGTSGGSLFGNTSGSLFGNNQSETKENKGGLFSGGLFDFSNINKKKEDEGEGEGEGEGDDNIGKSNSPKHEYNPENDNNNNKEDKDGYIKRYTKKVDNVFLYEKLKRTFVSRGEGFIIIETLEKENDEKKKERFARLVFRNTIGGIIFQGILNDQINKCIATEKKLKHLCLIIFLMKAEGSEELTLAQAKIPFSTQDEINTFSEKYKDTIKYLKFEIEDF